MGWYMRDMRCDAPLRLMRRDSADPASREVRGRAYPNSERSPRSRRAAVDSTDIPRGSMKRRSLISLTLFAAAIAAAPAHADDGVVAEVPAAVPVSSPQTNTFVAGAMPSIA